MTTWSYLRWPRGLGFPCDIAHAGLSEHSDTVAEAFALSRNELSASNKRLTVADQTPPRDDDGPAACIRNSCGLRLSCRDTEATGKEGSPLSQHILPFLGSPSLPSPLKAQWPLKSGRVATSSVEVRK